MALDLSNIRMEYTKGILDENSVDKDPLQQFTSWWQQANDAQIEEANAMTLSTVDIQGHADARIVLLKSLDDQGFIFFTNYNSKKGEQIAKHDQVCLLFFWKELERQVRIAGKAEKISAAESIRYFDSRPDKSKIGAWASPQSTVIAGKSWLTNTFQYYIERFKNGEIPKPPHWGGYRVIPQRIEFWQGRPNRMHDRIEYALSNGEWTINRLAP